MQFIINYRHCGDKKLFFSILCCFLSKLFSPLTTGTPQPPTSTHSRPSDLCWSFSSQFLSHQQFSVFFCFMPLMHLTYHNVSRTFHVAKKICCFLFVLMQNSISVVYSYNLFIHSLLMVTQLVPCLAY